MEIMQQLEKWDTYEAIYLFPVEGNTMNVKWYFSLAERILEDFTGHLNISTFVVYQHIRKYVKSFKHSDNMSLRKKKDWPASYREWQYLHGNSKVLSHH